MVEASFIMKRESDEICAPKRKDQVYEEKYIFKFNEKKFLGFLMKRITDSTYLQIKKKLELT